MTKTKRVYVWLTDKEFEYLMRNVKKSGLCREAYLRLLIEGYEVKEAPTKEWVELIHLLSSMANNLNRALVRAIANPTWQSGSKTLILRVIL
ncbi:hypothetical protein DSECCO2_241400 [anaerobic digester metagenome]